jgi:hypothetical protein
MGDSYFDGVRQQIGSANSDARAKFDEFYRYLSARLKRPYKIRPRSEQYPCYQISPNGAGASWDVFSLDLCLFSGSQFATRNSMTSGSVVWRADNYDQFVREALRSLTTEGAI